MAGAPKFEMHRAPAAPISATPARADAPPSAVPPARPYQRRPNPVSPTLTSDVPAPRNMSGAHVLMLAALLTVWTLIFVLWFAGRSYLAITTRPVIPPCVVSQHTRCPVMVEGGAHADVWMSYSGAVFATNATPNPPPVTYAPTATTHAGGGRTGH